MNSSLYECTVMHARFSPKRHRLAYRIFLFALDLDELPAVHRRLRLFSWNRANLYSFRDRDYLPTDEPVHAPTCPSRAVGHGDIRGATAADKRDAARDRAGLKDRVLAHLAARGIDLPGGRVMLVTLPRVLGYLFNPVSFYFCFDRAGRPAAALAEVTNTFREVKPFVLGPGTRGDPVFRGRHPKHFYVSPFSDVDVAFEFNLPVPGDRLAVRIDDYEGPRRTLTSTLAGRRRALTDRRLAWFTLKYPFLTMRIVAAIHWNALLLWLKRVPWYPKAGRASGQRDLYRPHSSLAQAAAREQRTAPMKPELEPSSSKA